MAYQTKSDDFFDLLTQLLSQKKINETIQLLSDATSIDPTLNGDLKFLKLRANKKLMAPAGGITLGTPQQQLKDVILLVNELKKAHARRTVDVSTLTDPTMVGNDNAPQKKKKSGKKGPMWPWVLLSLLLLTGIGGYIFKDKIMENETVQNFMNESSEEEEEEPVKAEKPVTKREKPKRTSNKVKPSSTDIGGWYIQLASYANLDPAKRKRKRVEMSYDRSIVLKKTLGSKSTYRILVPGFQSQRDAEKFKSDSRITNLYKGAFVESFSKECGSLLEVEDNVYECN